MWGGALSVSTYCCSYTSSFIVRLGFLTNSERGGDKCVKYNVRTGDDSEDIQYGFEFMLVQ
jgi:hypothetical protein